MQSFIKTAVLIAALAGQAFAQDSKTHPIAPLSVSNVVIDDEFWSPKLKVWHDVTIDDCFIKFENDRGGAINNFDLVRDGKKGKHAGPPWYDGLIYEMITGASDFLAQHRDAALEARLDGYIERIVAAQAKDTNGYVNTWTQTMAPQTQRWGLNGGDDLEQHEVYNAGAMIEAGVHYYKATGKTALLAAATRMANVMCDTIGPAPKENVIPGHSLAEDALVNLYRFYRDNPKVKQSVQVPVDEQRYLRLAEFFIDMRGHYEGRTGKHKTYGEYGQDHAPLAEQKTLEGHAVRATLFSAGITAAAEEDNRADYLAAPKRFWNSFALHKMYITGAGGAIGGDEKFGPDYFLPNDGYMETCAAVSGGFFSQNMNRLYGEARFVDVLERELYNAALGGVSLAGNRYYYQNPLIGSDSRRWNWHDCPCCPPMFLKMMGALPSYIYAQETNSVYVNLFIGSRANLVLKDKKIKLQQTTRYPWEGEVKIAVEPEKAAEFDLFVRIPDWCQGGFSSNDLYQVSSQPADGAVKLKINGSSVAKLDMVRGYARLHRQWKTGDKVEVTFDMPVRQVRAHPKIEADRGLVALMRGPVIYCAESVDNAEGIGNLFVPSDATFVSEFKPGLLGGVTVLRGQVKACYSIPGKPSQTSVELTAVPFYTSANRETGSMRVWLAASAEKAVPATLANKSTASASHCWHLDSASALNDGIVPEKSNDTKHSRLSWWDHKGTSEWAQLDFPQATEVSKVRVFWFADRTANGGCDLPQSWSLQYRDGNDWKSVENPSAYGLALDQFNEVTFAKIKTMALRINVQLAPGWSGGIYEWEVE